jgi:hypothetical protein
MTVIVFSFFCALETSGYALEATKLAEGVYGVKGPGMDFNTSLAQQSRFTGSLEANDRLILLCA